MYKKYYYWLFISFLLLTTVFYLHQKYKVEFTWDGSEEFFAKDQMITVTTYNIRYGKGIDNRVNLNRTIETLQSLDSDIISLQEIERYSVRSRFSDQVKIIADELNMNAVFYPTVSYPGIYYGNAILSRFPIEETETLSFINKRENRGAIFAKIKLSEAQSIFMVNTHLGLVQEERLEAFEKINQKLNEIKEPVILTGDLNTLPDHKEYDLWASLLHKSNKGKPIQTYYSRDWQIDYIFHSNEFIVNKTSVFTSDASDHYPVSAVLLLQNVPHEAPMFAVQNRGH